MGTPLRNDVSKSTNYTANFLPPTAHTSENGKEEDFPIGDVQQLTPVVYEETYKKMNDIALEVIWNHIKDRPFFRKAPFQQENVKGEQICEWFKNPEYAEGFGDHWISYCSEGYIPVLPVEVANFIHLKTLIIGNKHLKIISDMAFDRIGRLTQLRTLELVDNELVRLPDTINQLIRLKSLCLGGNQLSDLPHTLGQLTQLKHLGLEENKLVRFPNAISQLTRLKTLFLDGNRLPSIPSTVGNLTRLEVLSLHNNRLTSIPPTMTKLTLFGMPGCPEPDFTHHPLTLFGNLLVFLLMDEKAPNDPVPAQELMAKYVACSTYPCQTPLAILCQQIHLNADNGDLLQKFENLPAEMQEQIKQKLASISSSSLPWDPTDGLLVDKSRFVEAVITVVQEKFHALPPHEKGLAYRWVMILAGQLTQELDEQWAQTDYTVHPVEALTAAAANSVRLIEAMELVLNQQFPPTLSLEEPKTTASS